MSALALLAFTLLVTNTGAAGASDTTFAAIEPAESLSAQLAHADSAYFAGRDEEARLAYRVVLSRDPLSVRANHRLGLLLSRVDKVDSALVLIRRARTVEPADAGLLLDEARLLSWAGRLNESIADYDVLLALDPNQREARLGRARVLVWAGRYAAADSAYASILAADSNDVDALLGLARLRHDQGRQRSAAEQVSRVLSLDPESRDAATLERQIRAAQRPRVDLGSSMNQDSDRNVNWSRTLSASFAIADGVRGLLTGGSLAASDPTREATRNLGEVGIDAARGAAELTLATGGRWLDPAGGPTHYLSTYRSSLAVRAFSRLSAGVGFAHAPLDESALLIGSGIVMDDLEGNLDAALGHGLTASAGAGATKLSDGNRRASGLLALMHPLGQRGSVGLLGRVMTYEQRGVGYFSPDRFALAEARTSLVRSHRAWTGRLDAGLGAQQIGMGAASQLAWRAAGELQFGWATIDRVVASIGASNSAASSTTGAYRYLTASLALRLGS